MKKWRLRILVILGAVAVLVITFTLLVPYLIGSAIGPRDLDAAEIWARDSAQLQRLTAAIRTDSLRFPAGSHDFPEGFRYPFDEGYSIARSGAGSSPVTITYYLDRGLLDHYSAIIYTNDAADIRRYDQYAGAGRKSRRLDRNWYLIYE